MPINNGVGHSAETAEKVKVVDVYLTKLLCIINNIARQPKNQSLFPFHFIDLFCGPGINDDPYQTESLAVTILRKLQGVSWDWRADLIDIGETNGLAFVDQTRAELERNGILYDRDQVLFHCGSYQEKLPRIIEKIRWPKFGLILIDPNTPTECLEAAHALEQYARRLRMTDQLYHFAAMGWKRFRAYARNNGIAYDRYFTDLLEATTKKRALLRRSNAVIQQQWTFIYATNADRKTVNEFVREGWYDAARPKGQRMIKDLTFTESEQKEHSQDQEEFNWEKGDGSYGPEETQNPSAIL